MAYVFCPKCSTELIVVDIEGKQRQKCPACDFVHWDSPIPVVAAIVEHDGKVILTRSKGWPEKWVGIVAGFLEKNETPEQGVLREVKEELGLGWRDRQFRGTLCLRDAQPDYFCLPYPCRGRDHNWR